ncbi:hypothetical protein H0H93_009546 [Arthromyces matolae]|nr:hypothetical protein H0H93_009546 [Arthromyces matolae]
MQFPSILFLTVALYSAIPVLATDNSTLPLPTELDFGYTGIDGPLGWTRGNDLNPLCSTGVHQSPIDLDETIPFIRSHVNLAIPDGSYNFTNNGHTMVIYLGGNLSVGAHDYELVQFHFHTPAEHLIEHVFYPLEMHLVFRDAGASDNDPFTLAIGVLFEVSATSTTQLLNTLAKTLPKTTGSTVTTDKLVFGPLIDHIEHGTSYTYQGSLTTPPCSEGLKWLVSQQTLDVDVQTYKDFKGVMKFNARYLQNSPGQENLITFAKDNYPTHT